MPNEIPRRICVDKWTPAEHAISDAMKAVEDAGAHEHLTAAVVLLGKAMEKVADFVDGIPVVHLWWNGYDHAPGATAEEATRWLMAQTGCDAEDAEGDDGWDQIDDDTMLRDGPVASPTDEKALDVARAMVARWPIPPAPSSTTPEKP